MEWRPRASVAVLRRRAELLARTRAFFQERGVLEVETPVLQGGANCDPGSQSLAVRCGAEERFLPTSPEHPLKRLVAAGAGPVWTLAPAFRLGERSPRHQPEFRMLEWYRPGWHVEALLTEVIAWWDALTGAGLAVERLSYREAFRRHVGLDPALAGPAQWAQVLPPALVHLADDPGAAADYLLATRIEPHLGTPQLTALTDYPPRLAAQAEVRLVDGHPAAARFELYRHGVELANGYQELTDGEELRARWQAEAGTRTEALRPDARFFAAMAAGLPACAGVAVGFDRVVMLALGLPEVAQTMAFPWDDA